MFFRVISILISMIFFCHSVSAQNKSPLEGAGLASYKYLKIEATENDHLLFQECVVLLSLEKEEACFVFGRVDGYSREELQTKQETFRSQRFWSNIKIGGAILTSATVAALMAPMTSTLATLVMGTSITTNSPLFMTGSILAGSTFGATVFGHYFSPKEFELQQEALEAIKDRNIIRASSEQMERFIYYLKLALKNE